MSDTKLISPMLDNFSMGDPISERKGIKCCPAINNDTNDKFIVKIISVPASQVQMDALLLSGAYESKEAALEYYQSLAKDISDEAEVLKKLSQLEGFISSSSWQIVPMEDGNGFDIYILSPYHHTVERMLRQESMTHLGALNLALDICAALTVCRRAGYLYVDLKPENIFILNGQDYRIGDIGFVKLNSLKYASLPDRYRSQYTAPEIADAFSSLNTTLDVYALGLILYQIYNDGALPFKDSAAPAESFSPPAYADYEIAEIILKACAPDPASRWQDPVEMGQALVSYMQRNGANDTLIVPTTEPEPSTIEEDCANVESNDQATAEEAPSYEADISGSTSESDATSQEEVRDQDPSDDSIDCPDSEISESNIYSVDDEGNLTFIDETTDDETAHDQDPDNINYDEVTEEVSDILQQADDLIAHPTPDPVIQPDPIDVPVPDFTSEDSSETAIADTANEQDGTVSAPSSDEDTTETPEVDTTNTVVSPETNNTNPLEETNETIINETNETATVVFGAEQDDDTEYVVKPKKRWAYRIILAILALGLIAGGIFYYRNFYLQPIETIKLEHTADGILTVYVTSELNENKLYVLCTDAYGNQLKSPVKNGKAVFTNLSPGSAFNVEVQPNGFYRLTGDTTAAYTTPSLTNILHFQATTGSENGSVILGFTVEGPDSEQWRISYTDDNGAAAEVTFPGHITTITGLTVGNSYTFTLFPIDDVRTTGEMQVTHVASNIVKADRVEILSRLDNSLTVKWKVPANATVESWSVRCYNDTDYDETVVTSETTATFDITDTTPGYTVEVTAAGMSVSERAYASADAITVSDLKVDGSDPRQLHITWSADSAPSNGWILLYSVDNGTTQELSCGAEMSAAIAPAIPGCKYNIAIQSTDGASILGGTTEYTVPISSAFTGFGTSADNMTFYMCRRPNQQNWTRQHLKSYDYVAEFTLNEKASYLVRLQSQQESSAESVAILFVIRDKDNKLISAEVLTESWDEMWSNRDCTLDIPTLPDLPGNYSISIYFNGLLVNENSFTMVS